MQAKLPHFLSFRSAEDLVRIGREFDGGYLVSKADIENSEVLIGLGVNDDWSFEEQFIAQKDIEVFAYDASVSQKHFFKKFLKSLIRADKPRLAVHWFKTLLKYRKFFSNHKVHHIKRFVGVNSSNGVYNTLSEVLERTEHSNIFLKIDVEGSEYRFLNTLVEHQSRITGLAIELHDCDIHLQKIEEFIREFNLNLVHVHANNNAPVRLDDELPLVIELTFSKYGKLSDDTFLPHQLDMPNNKNHPEICLMIAD